MPGARGEATTTPADLPRCWAAAQTPRCAGEGAHGWRRTPTGTPLPWCLAWCLFSQATKQLPEQPASFFLGEIRASGQSQQGLGTRKPPADACREAGSSPDNTIRAGAASPCPPSKLSSPFLPPAIPAMREINVISARPRAAPAPSCCTGSCCDSPWARVLPPWPRMAQGPGTAQGSHSLPLRTGRNRAPRTQPPGTPQPVLQGQTDGQSSRAGLQHGHAEPHPIQTTTRAFRRRCRRR